jgi:hypothetical protein
MPDAARFNRECSPIAPSLVRPCFCNILGVFWTSSMNVRLHGKSKPQAVVAGKRQIDVITARL